MIRLKIVLCMERKHDSYSWFNHQFLKLNVPRLNNPKKLWFRKEIRWTYHKNAQKGAQCWIKVESKHFSVLIFHTWSNEIPKMTPVGISENSLDLLGILGPGPPVRSTSQCIIPSNQRHRLRRISPFEFSEYHSTGLYSYDSCFLPMSKYHFFLDYQKTERVPKIGIHL